MVKCLLLLIFGSAILLTVSNGRAADCDSVNFKTLLRDQQTGIAEASDFVIRTDSGWTEFWNKAHSRMLPTPEAPEIDLSDRIVIVAAAGQKPNGCYGIAIERIDVDTAGNYIVHVADITPPPEMMCTMALVYPVHAVSAPVPKGEVRFVHRQVDQPIERGDTR